MGVRVEPVRNTTFRPQTEILIKTWRGKTYNLTAKGQNAFVSWSTSKDTSGQPGSFTIQLTAVRDSDGQSWCDKIYPMDYVEIRAAVNPQRSGSLPIIMRGFVETCEETLAFGDAEGGPTRSVVVQGADYTIIYQNYQIQYLWQTSTFAYAVNLMTKIFPFAMDTFFQTSFLGTGGTGTLQGFIKALDSKILPVYLERLAAYFKGGIPLPISKVYMPTSPLVAPTYVENFTGTLWDLYTYYQSPPIGEMFIYDPPGSSAPELLFRIAPYRNASGNFPDIPLASHVPESLLPTYEIDPLEILAFQIGRTQQNAQNYWFTEADSSLTDTLTAAAFTGTVGSVAGVSAAGLSPSSLDGMLAVSGYITSGTQIYNGSRPANPMVDDPSINLYGLRASDIQSPWLSGILANIDTTVSNGGNVAANDNTLQAMQELAVDMTHWQWDVFRDNPIYLAGSITCHGREQYVVGRYIRTHEVTTSGYTEFYVTSVEHTFTQFEEWTTTLGVSRGIHTS